MFRDSFKYYKSRNPAPDLSKVIDFDDPDHVRVKYVKPQVITDVQFGNNFGLKPTEKWKIYELLDIPGLIFIRDPFTSNGQRYWIMKCLKDYSKEPYKLNIDAHNILNNEIWWDVCFQSSERAKTLLPKLRWATLGYHHNWNTKLYSESSKSDMPVELLGLTSTLAKALDFRDFKAEAAIVNYYRMNSTLAGHTDQSEVNIAAPLFSMSFGQTAIFLIGGSRQEDPADAMFLRSGDVVIMSGSSRLRYHGIPKILAASEPVPWDVSHNDSSNSLTYNQDDWHKARAYIAETRININARQVLEPGQIVLY
ncbi:nucleic acid dioxygenase ALKBH1 isoform X1 [Harpegnathos saltator]|uniref:Alkylated DNA repair protein alkB-like protein 1 n=1 Tax=Harpegnathos saltator TaxID=610380 RepID=E2BRT0_HARSA|nr:nucleic acid dioxygenase ALKBH1 isoform X1 [Harpegnathos saltator]EFN81599.1 Alkylated DNA repair protein alkB-like protein 1 [Harpegnathos saltator]